MALSRGAKIAIGCGLAAVLAAGLAVAALVGIAWWGASKARQLDADQKRVQADLEKANAHTFTPPGDGLVREDRLLRFLAVRKAIHDEAYLKHRDVIEAQAGKQKPDLSALARIPFILSEVRAVRARELARHEMSEGEFDWLFRLVYAGMPGAATSRRGTVSAGDLIRRADLEAAEQAEKTAAAAESNPALSPETKRQMRETAERRRRLSDRSQASRRLPAANRALFEKYRDEIQKYTMRGLEDLAS
jgi:hypothetical protein